MPRNRLALGGAMGDAEDRHATQSTYTVLPLSTPCRQQETNGVPAPVDGTHAKTMTKAMKGMQPGV